MYNYYFFCSCENELYNYSIKPSLSTTSIMDRQLLCQSKSNNLSNENINTGVSVIFKTRCDLKCHNKLKVAFFRKFDGAQKNMPNHYLKLEFLSRRTL